jgi:hypothetical protein
VEIRNGGPAIGYQTVSAQMYADKSITLGQVNTDEAVANSKSQPTIAVVAPLEISPLMILWGTKAHPDFNTIADIGQTDTKILYYQTDAYAQYLIGAGLVGPARWTARTTARRPGSSPRRARSPTPGSPPRSRTSSRTSCRARARSTRGLQLINDTGYPMYSEALSIRAEDKDKLAPCLKKLVPILQQASVDFISNPGPTNQLVISTVEEDEGLLDVLVGMADYAVKTLKSLGLVGNGPDKTLGNIQDSRIQRMIDILKPIYATQHKEIKDGLKPSDIYTNEYINPAIGLTASSK